jgi:isoquinoline 1-oxidoreductase beta subunit
MTGEPFNGILDTQISRRGFMKTAGGLTFAFTFAGGLTGRAAQVFAAESARMNAWVTIGADDIVTVMMPVSEMGQGTLTALPLILAEELDADWSKVKAEYAPTIPKIYGNYHPAFNGAQINAYSAAVGYYFKPLRIAGAQARRVLLDNVARQWSVPVSELSTEPSMIVHANSARRISYGDVVKFASVPAEPPQISDAELKKPSQFKLIGRTDLQRVDVPSKVNGAAKYGIDVRLPGMVYASVLESPAEGAKPEKVNVEEVMKISGVKRVLPLPFGVAVIAETMQASRKGRNALRVQWDYSGAAAKGLDSEQALEEYARHGRDPNAKAMEAFKKGDARKALAEAAKTVTAEYQTVHCYHAQMEPMNCVARVAPDGQSAEVWTGSQFSALHALVAANILKTTPDKIRTHQHLIGGGFGRRISPDAVAQAVVLSNITKETVKLTLMREDDFAAARLRPMTHHILKAGLDANGNLMGWYHRLVAENVDAVASPPRFKATGGRDFIGWEGLDQPIYAIPNHLSDAVREMRGVRVYAWRGIGSGYNRFASESFIDEVAHAAGKDPLAFRLELTKDHARANAVLRAVDEMANWNRPRSKDRALGLAFSDYNGTVVAGVSEVSVDKTGRIRVHNHWVAADPGIVIHPENAVAQLESAVVYALSGALFEEVTIKNGGVVQTNFHQYPVPRMSDMPEIHARVIPTDNAPSGLGEIGVPCVAPSIANAVFRLTGVRLRRLPMSPARVQAARKTQSIKT